MVVSVDWFALSCNMAVAYDGRPLSLPPGWQQVPLSSTAVWKHRIYVLDPQGQKVATILAVPHSPAIPETRVLIEIANYWLYLDCFSDVVGVVLDSLPVVVDGMNRVDLCCDFEMTPSLWQVVRSLEAGDAYLKGLRRGVVWWSSKVGERSPHQLSWGGKESVFKWKLYYKWKELHEGGIDVCSKPYIEALWTAVGMDPRRVWRLEVSLSHCNRLSLMDGERRLKPMDWWTDRAQIFASIYTDKFVVREGMGHADRRNDPTLTFLDIRESKLIRHALPSDVHRETDAQRRIAYRMWMEFRDPEVRADPVAFGVVRGALMDLFQLEPIVSYVAFRSGSSVADIVECLCEGDKAAVAGRPLFV